MKAIMISNHAIWCAKIMNGEKSIEVRKNKALYKATKKLIEEQGYATFFMYCTKGERLYKQFDRYDDNGKMVNVHWHTIESLGGFHGFNGKVVAKFTLRKVEEIFEYIYPNYYGEDICDEDDFYYLESQPLSERKYDGLKKTTCLSEEELYEYLNGEKGYAYHIEDLVIFDKPKELSEFRTKINAKGNKLDHVIDMQNYGYFKPLIKAPQNFCYIEVNE